MLVKGAPGWRTYTKPIPGPILNIFTEACMTISQKLVKKALPEICLKTTHTIQLHLPVTSDLMGLYDNIATYSTRGNDTVTP